ncbi:hypothetical protein [Streptomyces sp. NPDC046925]|uniref:hypothetical protein n=1 Tax=Streptomyces sp. NPDC046925 TaxID=3155375 RepID=UPI0033DC057F
MTARHFMKPGSISQSDLIADIEDDITSAHGAAKDLDAVGSPRAQSMHDAADEYLDERAAAKNGTWQPNHPV